MAIGFVGRTRALGRKRVVISKNGVASPLDSNSETPLKRRCSGRMVFEPEKSQLEALPQDILIKILCGVEHDDLKQLFDVSTAIREATAIAKKWHFAYNTPTKKSRAFRTRLDLEDSDELDEIEAPKAPSRRYKARLDGKKLNDISVALFSSMDE
ncbi:F-box protein [Quillaja saponaria]|uniref:F-box protein n=1 Tax=Quillaja saponaria TaxID=32244 RepID=A0AAD7M2H9_QUISA|nr:F-box protein [Quillaja saponaria]